MGESKKFLIGGDSWGMGVWNDGADSDYRVVHPGFNKLLEDAGYTVHNCCQSNSSNIDSIRRLDSLIKDRYADGDIIIWFQSDPIRDLRGTDMTTELLSAGTPKQLVKKILNKNYQQLDIINKPIHAVGGLCNLDTELLRLYNNIKAFVPSWVYLLVNDLYPEVSERTVLGDVACNVKELDLNKFTKEQRMLLVDELHEMNETKHFYVNEMFKPDYRHPNLDGHRILFKEIEKLI